MYAAYAAAMAHKGQPTVILAHTVKGFGLGKAAEGQMVAHQQKKMDAGLAGQLPRQPAASTCSDEDIAGFQFVKPAEDSEEIRYLKTQREKLGGYLPRRDTNVPPLAVAAAGHLQAAARWQRLIARSPPPWPSCAS